MGTWGSGNFDSDGALDFVAGITDDLTARIEAILSDDEASMLDEEGEAVLVPSVHLLAVLHESTGATIPKADVVARWKAHYLALFDAQIGGLDPAEGFEAERRTVIVETFDRLAALAEAFWKG